MREFRSKRSRWVVGIMATVIVTATAASQVPTGYTIEAFSDEFDGVSLDTTKWNAGIISYPSGSTWLRRNHPGNDTVAGGGQLRLSGSSPGFAGRITIVHGEVRLDSTAAIGRLDRPG